MDNLLGQVITVIMAVKTAADTAKANQKTSVKLAEIWQIILPPLQELRQRSVTQHTTNDEPLSIDPRVFPSWHPTNRMQSGAASTICSELAFEAAMFPWRSATGNKRTPHQEKDISWVDYRPVSTA